MFRIRHIEKSLVPIRVGMILLICLQFMRRSSCPHTRGDDPAKRNVEVLASALSPYAWG